jgi:PPOX class probable F420-dependent enzyme
MTILGPDHAAFLDAARRAVLATVGPDGRPRQVPVCFALVASDEGVTLYSPLDEKPKRAADPHALARVRDLVARSRVTLLADRWDEDWARLAWLRVEATASLVEPGTTEHVRAVEALRARYPQYRDHALETRPLIRLVPTRTVWWSGGGESGPGEGG